MHSKWFWRHSPSSTDTKFEGGGTRSFGIKTWSNQNWGTVCIFIKERAYSMKDQVMLMVPSGVPKAQIVEGKKFWHVH